MATENRRPLIAVIGDGGVAAGTSPYLLAERLGERLVDNGFRVLTGGLGGIMAAACEGARRSVSYRNGDTIGLLPGHDAWAAGGAVDISIPTGLDTARNTIVAHADAVIAVGGGAGTLSEAAAAWIFNRLVIAFKIEGWSGRLADTRIDGRNRYDAVPDDRVYGVETPEEAVALLGRLLPLYRKSPRGLRGM